MRELMLLGLLMMSVLSFQMLGNVMRKKVKVREY